MRFHNVHGSGITLSENRSVASRSDAQFCNGIVFSDTPLRSGQKICVEVACTQNWSGTLRIGFTTVDPHRTGHQDVPKYAIPHFAKKDGFWVRQISEALITDKTQLMLYVTGEGLAQFFVDNEHKGALFINLPTDRPLWILFDVYGNTKAIKFVKPADAPKEISARGPDAIKAFESACQSGMLPVCKTRLMVVGQEGAGKTCLKNSLLGQMYDVSVKPTSGIDISTSCTYTVGSHGNWKTLGLSHIGQEIHNEKDNDNGILGSVEALEEEYNQALANNIVQELMYQKRHKAPSSTTSSSSTNAHKPRSSTSSTSKDSHRNSAAGAKKLSSKPSSATMSDKISEIPTEMFKEVPSAVVDLVQKMLDSSSLPQHDTKSQDSVSVSSKCRDNVTKMVLNIWDFAGKEAYYTTHQVFLASRAVYIVVFNLQDDLQENFIIEETSKLSALDHLDFWMRSIFAHASTTSKNSSMDNVYSPPIFIVGSHRRSLSTDETSINKMVEEKMSQVQEFLVGKPYVQHVVTPFFAIDNSFDEHEIEDLRNKIEEVASHEPYIGERMPIRWIRFEQEIAKLVAQGFNYASYDQITEIAGDLDITDYKEVMTMLEFYHDLGTIIYYGSGRGTMDNQLRNTIILKPQWLIDMFRHVICSHEEPQDKWNLIRDKWTRLEEFGILEESLLDTLWSEARDQKTVLLGLLEKFDLICQRLPTLAEAQTDVYTNNKSFYVPSRLNPYSLTKKLFTVEEKDVDFYIYFHGYLPGGLFQRILSRTIRWSQGHGGQNPYYLYKSVARFFLDTEHDFILEQAAKHLHRIKVVVMRVANTETSKDEKGDKSSTPNPEACARVRNFLESMLSELKEVWLKRVSYSVCTRCPCDRVCESHKKEGCTQESCIHFLNLDECLTNKVVMCEHRRIKTALIKKDFPEPLTLGFSGPVLPPMSLVDSCGNIEKHCPFLPSWVKTAAKLLNTGDPGKDWNALARELGYKQNQINSFNDDLNPGLALLADWIITSGNTGLSVDMLTVYLDKLDREDVSEVIQKAQESEHDPAQIFLSYQWDCQDEVKLLRDRLERSGFTCWMDIGQLGGGDQLFTKIDQALRSCKAVLACVSPKFVVSSHCMKEMSLADLLRKPIIPIMVENTVWPPPGGMSLIFSQLVYINLKGIGGHGGTGIHADRADKYKEIIQRISLHAVPDLTRCTLSDVDADSKCHFIDNDYCSMGNSTADADRASSHSSSRHSVIHRRMDRVHRRESVINPDWYPAVEEVHVSQCRVCTIL